MPEQRGRIIGIGGIFFKSPDRAALSHWYQQNLGIDAGDYGATFLWRSPTEPSREHRTVWSLFPPESDYFGPGPAPFMINYIVEGLDDLLSRLRQNGVTIDPKLEESDYGRFAWIHDPDGNKIELWEPPQSRPADAD